MTQTFTPAIDFPAKNDEKKLKCEFSERTEPSKDTIQNILNFSKNLEIKDSSLIDKIELLKS